MISDERIKDHSVKNIVNNGNDSGNSEIIMLS